MLHSCFSEKNKNFSVHSQALKLGMDTFALCLKVVNIHLVTAPILRKNCGFSIYSSISLFQTLHQRYWSCFSPQESSGGSYFVI